MKKYQTKPLPINAIQFNGKNQDEIIEWVKDHGGSAFVYGPGPGISDDVLLFDLGLGQTSMSVGEYLIDLSHGAYGIRSKEVFEANHEEVK